MKSERFNQTKKITMMGLLIGLAFASLYVVRIPIIPSASFLRFDIKDIFITIGGLAFGSWYALAGVVCVSILQMFSVSEYGTIGLVMNIVSSCSFAVPISFVYKKTRNNKGLITGLALGCVSIVVTMLLWNYLITPLYMGVTREMVKGMILPVFLPFNLLKSLINAIIIYFAFRNIVKIDALYFDK